MCGQMNSRIDYIGIPEVIIELKPSRIVNGEVGVFSVKDLAKGTIIWDGGQQEESFFSWSVYRKLDKVTQRKVDAFCLGTQQGFYSPPDINYLTIPWYLNHSCNGNVGFDRKGNFILIDSIEGDIELCYDYGLAESNPRFKMKCMCRSENCRKIITGNDWRDPQFRKANLKYMMPELRKIRVISESVSGRDGTGVRCLSPLNP